MQTRNTIQRKVILDAVRELQNHPTSEDVYNHIKPKYPSISLGTVYRNLNLLSDTNEIKKITLTNEAVRFDDKIFHHYHMYCKKCGELFDVFMDYNEHVDKIAQDKSGFMVDGHDTIFSGICLDCQNKEQYKEI